MRRTPKPLLLLDRDGTLIKEKGYPNDPRQVELYPGAAPALRRLKRAGFRLAVTSNQSGVGRGLVTLDQMYRVNRRFLQLLQQKKARVDGVYWCPHRPARGCSCRKPALGMARRAAKDLHVPWKNSISVGDRPSDVEFGQRTGGLGVLVLTGYGRRYRQKSLRKPDHIAVNFARAADWIIRRQERMSA